MTMNDASNAPAARPRSAIFEYVFPAIRGVQAGREYYVTMCPLRLIPRLFVFDDEELPPEMRAQRTLNKARVPEIARYVAENPSTYVFSALTASINAEVNFEAFGTGGGPGERVGTLTIPMSAKFVINDGQHRRAAIQQALLENPELGDESIAIVMFIDVGLDRRLGGNTATRTTRRRRNRWISAPGEQRACAGTCRLLHRASQRRSKPASLRPSGHVGGYLYGRWRRIDFRIRRNNDRRARRVDAAGAHSSCNRQT